MRAAQAAFHIADAAFDIALHFADVAADFVGSALQVAAQAAACHGTAQRARRLFIVVAAGKRERSQRKSKDNRDYTFLFHTSVSLHSYCFIEAEIYTVNYGIWPKLFVHVSSIAFRFRFIPKKSANCAGAALVEFVWYLCYTILLYKAKI